MSFFHQIHNLGDDADLTLRIVRKDDKLTIDVRPGARTSLTPKVITGTPEDLADGFLQAILAKPEKETGLAVQELPNDGPPKKEEPVANKTSSAKKEQGAKTKYGKKNPPPKVKPGKGSKAAAPKEVSMFDQQPVEDTKNDEEVDADQSSENEEGKDDNTVTEE